MVAEELVDEEATVVNTRRQRLVIRSRRDTL
jgi:hypothetical protein